MRMTSIVGCHLAMPFKKARDSGIEEDFEKFNLSELPMSDDEWVDMMLETIEIVDISPEDEKWLEKMMEEDERKTKHSKVLEFRQKYPNRPLKDPRVRRGGIVTNSPRFHPYAHTIKHASVLSCRDFPVESKIECVFGTTV